MVWGMASPGRFGDFFPDGDYVGWKEELVAYFNNRMPTEKKALFDPPHVASYIYYAAENLISEPGLKRPDLPPFSPIAAHEAPKRFVTEKQYASLGSLIILTGQILAVDAPLKEIIERFEPDAHHFFPIEIVMPKKAVYPKQYFVMAIGSYLDSFSPERSDPASWENRIEGYCSFEEEKKLMSGLALTKQIFGAAQLWRERRMLNHLICFSDQLMTEVARAGLRLPKHCKLKEI
jgi:hypothetical protein